MVDGLKVSINEKVKKKNRLADVTGKRINWILYNKI